MGTAISIPLVARAPELQPIRFIDFQDFCQLGRFPRFPEDERVAQEASSLELSDAFVIYISHMWLRSRPTMKGYKKHPRPDTEENDQYNLCVAGIKSLLLSNKIKLANCYLWIDFGCLDQGEPEFMPDTDSQLGHIMYLCDCMFTPDSELPEIAKLNCLDDMEKVKSMGHAAYLNRGWCRLEMFYSSFIPLSKTSLKKKSQVSRAVEHALDACRRPHFAYGAIEMTKKAAPVVVPFMRYSYLSVLDPVKGFFTNEEDLSVVKTLVKQLAYHFMKPLKLGYEGSTNNKGARDGHGRFVFSSGAVYEGGYLNGVKHGFGRFDLANGDAYEGGYKNDRRHGHGVFKFASGDRYEGAWANGKPNGQGKVEYASGDLYEGSFKDRMKHGFGIFRFSSGCRYEGWYKNDLRHGKGKYVWNDGDIYDGEWKDHVKHGYGTFKFASGACYQGHWKEDNRHGHGRYKLMNGEVYEGEYNNDMREGHGTYVFNSGAKYDGMWKRHLKNGWGILYAPHSNFIVYEGEWIEDKPQGYVDPLLIFEEDIQYMEVLAVIENAEATKPIVIEEPLVHDPIETIEPEAARVTGQLSEEYYNANGILDEEDDFHPKNLFRRKSEDWIDREPKWVQPEPENIEANLVDENEENEEILQEFHVEEEISKVNGLGSPQVDEDHHEKVKKMFSPARKIVNAMKMKRNFASTSNEIKSDDNDNENSDKDILDQLEDEASVDETSGRLNEATE